jgi:hypothetical protein
MRSPLGAPGLIVGFLLVAACGHPLERKLEGRWLGQGVENFDDRDMASATGWAKGLLFEFAGSSLTVSIPAEEPRTAPYRVASAYHNDVKLSVERKDGKVDTLSLKLDDEQSLRWVLGDGRSVVLRREP